MSPLPLPIDAASRLRWRWAWHDRPCTRGALLDEGGIGALRSVPGRGRPAKLDEGQLASVRAAILQSPTEHGFGTDLWTFKRVGAVIERLHGVRFSQPHVWLILGSLAATSSILLYQPKGISRSSCWRI